MAVIRTDWDDKYREGMPSLAVVDPFFERAFNGFISKTYPRGGNALDLAAGLGRHSLVLAKHNWQTMAVDSSAVALVALQQTALAEGVTIRTVTAKATDCQLPRDYFDLIVLYYHFERQLFPSIHQALKPGGLLICKLAVSWSGRPAADHNLELPLEKEEFLSLVTSFATIIHSERPVRNRGVVEYLGKKI